ncbi:LysR family transcriptional regulator [Oceanobacillus neutriphilus]|uniref:LysR family transcriptional regulator n=1 Tax=Oceanobacillus neutriphilus TaxID=531815 RepID=A0ABQ2P152_9BACI|nr:LysR family transcriptional regulator [Oceanobacillus neutriphilus]GGP15679.1 LysR family transcriptional regulator [Oceanobacillus neutriphilus]
MRMDDYEILLKLYEIGTIRGTAKAILISQPAVTQRLKYMENYFGETIFIRTSKRLLPTPAGERVIQHAKEMVEKEHLFKNRLAETGEEIQGTLSIACSSLISQRYLPDILGEYTAAYPKVAVDLVTGISEDIRKNHKQYHVCIIRGDKLKETTSVHLFDDPLYIFDTEPFPDHAVKERPIISFKSDDSMHELVDSWLFEQQNYIKPQKKMTVDQIETCKQFMKQGIGMAVLPGSVSNHLKEHYPYIPLFLEKEAVTRDTWACFQEGIRQLPQVDHFLRLLENYDFIAD